MDTPSYLLRHFISLRSFQPIEKILVEIEKILVEIKKHRARKNTEET